MHNLLKSSHTKLMNVIPFVQTYDDKLSSLTDWWHKISLIGKINSRNVPASILDDMLGTREKLEELHDKLIRNLLLEHLQKCTLSDISIAQVAIDILIRNLFERTADVGFLATDHDIRDFLENPSDNAQAFIETRLAEYIKKYSVYDEVVILDAQGNVRAHLDQSNPIHHCKDQLIEETIASDADYLETFRHSDIQPDQSDSLIYSCRITSTNDRSSRVLGVLCLCFRFDDEMSSIFENLLQDKPNSVLVLLDQTGRVISSSRPAQVPLASQLKVEASPRLLTFQKTEYITNATQTKGYQGFFGLSWSSQILTPLREAFSHSDQPGEVDSSTEKIQGSKLFSQELQEIHRSSSSVNDELSLIVLNGKIASARNHADEFMPVLEEIKKIGNDTANIFHTSISSLQSIVLSSRLNDVQFMAALAVDIMDRNLYERANDCRWWALTSAFRNTLAKPEKTLADLASLSEILGYINSLYTVYSNLFIYDDQGKILAVSNPLEQGIVGQYANEHSGAKTALGIKDLQKYSVSPFVPSPFYNERHTYIYNAPIADLSGMRVVGGIGIVFDSEPQFEQMLLDTLPRNDNGQVAEGCFALFVEPGGKVIAATTNAVERPGEAIELERHFFDLAKGEKRAGIVSYHSNCYTVGAAMSLGYREYKTTGDYSNDVIALVFMPI
jgi:hypothetical protein